jgi:hypothetical protein
MTTYKLFNSIGQSYVIKDDISVIPFDPANTDYQDYLAWVAEGGQVLPADSNA